MAGVILWLTTAAWLWLLFMALMFLSIVVGGSLLLLGVVSDMVGRFSVKPSDPPGRDPE